MTSGLLIVKVGHAHYYIQFCIQSIIAETDGMFAHSEKLMHVNLHFKSLSRFPSLTLQKTVTGIFIYTRLYNTWVSLKRSTRSKVA